ncbi:MAG: hypothetical protein LBH73_00205, partial [Spirochaetaceae bacterium]|nr:hypothetical protein [Spirochaetaceae bacterium]
MVYRQNMAFFFISVSLLVSFPLFARGTSENRSPILSEEERHVPGGDLYNLEESPPEGSALRGRAERVESAPSRGEQVTKALAAAYPGVIDSAEYRNGDWAVQLRGAWYYYAGGRMLPEEYRSRLEEYDPQPFYNYQKELAPWREPGQEEAER